MSGSFDNRESQHRELARGINEFIANPQPPRRQQWVLPWNRWLLFILAVPLVGGAMLRAGAARIRIDRPQDRVEVVRYMLLWRQRRELSLAEVREFRVMAKRMHGQTFYGPGFVLTDGTEMPLTHMWNSSADKHRAIIEILEAFRSPPVRPPMG